MILHILLLTCSIGRAQQNAEYNFYQQSLNDGHSYGPGDPVPVLTMDCLAANGYGQWTLSSISNGSYSQGWYLLENALRQPSLKYDPSNTTDHPGCIPPGVVENGTLNGAYPSEPEAAANMDGMVNFLWPDPTNRSQFILQGFSPGDIDISLNGIPNPATTLQIVKTSNTPNTLANQWTASTIVGGLAHDVVTSTGDEADYHDEFAVKMDASFIYIAWCSKTNTPITGQPEIYVMALNASTRTPAIPAMDIGPGRRPSIACDVRANRTSSTPAFSLGYVNAGVANWVQFNGSTITPFVLHPQFMDPNSMALVTYATVLHVEALQSAAAGAVPNYALYAIVRYNGPASPGGSNNLILYNSSNPHLAPSIAAYVDGIFMTPELPCPRPIPGPGVNPGWPVHDAPITAFANMYDNQYSSSETPPDWRYYDQFHCLYQYDISTASPGFQHPLLLVRGSDNGDAFPLSIDPNFPSGSPDLRVVMNVNSLALLPDPDNSSVSGVAGMYVAAVNQMGIHVHWRTTVAGTPPSTTHYYARDWNRVFDENIDENTLVTSQCFVENGTWHGGTLGASLGGAYQMTVWTDPNYGQSSIDPNSGLYQPPPVGATTTDLVVGGTPYGSVIGTLSFGGVVTDGYYPPSNLPFGLYPSIDEEYVTLCVVGSGWGPGPTLSVMPDFQFNFDPNLPPVYYSTQGVTIMNGGTFNYYGLSTRTVASTITPEDHFSANSGGGTNFSDFDGEGTLSLQGSFPLGEAANLIVHGGANLHVFENAFFTATDANIQVLNEPNLFPIIVGSTSATNQNKSGVMTFDGPTQISYSTITGYSPASPSAPTFGSTIIHVPNPTTDDGDFDENAPGAYDPPYQYVSSYNTYHNSPSDGFSKIAFDNNTWAGGHSSPYILSSFNNDAFNSIEIYALDPQDSFTVANSAFTGSVKRSIDIETSLWPSTYGDITIYHNTFGGEAHRTVAYVYLYDLNTQSLGPILITNNTMNASLTHGNDPLGGIADPLNGIELWNSDAWVTGNTLTGGFSAGIVDYGPASSPFDQSFFCSNTINKSSTLNPSYGFFTSGYSGFIKLNEMEFASTGYMHSGGGVANLLGDKIHDCVGDGIYNEGIIDMSGIHHTGPPPLPTDWAGYNEVHDNGSNQIELHGSIADLYLTRSGYSLSVNGLNNIYQGSSNSTVLIEGYLFANPVEDISNNFWGGSAIDPNLLANPDATYWPNYSYSAPNPASAESSPPFYCASLDRADKLEKKHQLSIEVVDSCTWALNACENLTEAQQYDQAFDTITWYIMHCYKDANPAEALQDYLGGCAGAASEFQTEAGRLQYRKWILDTVLELRTDNEWFCFAVQALLPSYDHYGSDIPATLAILQFLADNPRCAAYQSTFGTSYYGTRLGQIMHWQDTAKSDSMIYFDSTLPSFQILGLDTLLSMASVAHYDSSGVRIILAASVTQNPFKTATSLSLVTNREAYIHVEVMDLLGRKLEGSGYGGVIEPGCRAIPLKLDGIPSGTYYVRLSTANNEVRTLKLIKQE